MERITFDGYDPFTGDTIKEINVCHDYRDRTKPKPGTKKSLVATVKHGSSGILLERDGAGCKVRVKKGRRFVDGWVTYWFIKELKQEFVAEIEGKNG
jgi:hypothetical protein